MDSSSLLLRVCLVRLHHSTFRQSPNTKLRSPPNCGVLLSALTKEVMRCSMGFALTCFENRSMICCMNCCVHGCMGSRVSSRMTSSMSSDMTCRMDEFDSLVLASALSRPDFYLSRSALFGLSSPSNQHSWIRYRRTCDGSLRELDLTSTSFITFGQLSDLYLGMKPEGGVA